MPNRPTHTEYPVKLFMHGGSQAVRLRKELRMEGTEAVAYWEEGCVVIRPIEKKSWPEGYWKSFGPVGADFAVPEPLPPSPKRDRRLRFS